MFKKSSISGLTLESAGLVALSRSPHRRREDCPDRDSILAGHPCPCPRDAPAAVRRRGQPLANFHKPGSLTNGYVFRVENPATVSYLQSIGRTGYLVTAVDVPWLCYILLCPILTIIVFALVGSIKDWWALAVLGMLVLSRTINVSIIKRRVSDSRIWKGAKEEGTGDLLIVLSQDRWIRLQGEISDVKRVTAGQWLRDEDRAESLAVGFATLLVYAAAALAGNASTIGSLLIACLLLCSVALLALCNSFTHCLQMYDCIVQESQTPKEPYERRMAMVKALVEELKNDEKQECKSGAWAINMQLIHSIDELDDNFPLCESRRRVNDSQERIPFQWVYF
ncbi:hypothetical protein IW261DRAFT_1570896 [Armillaria novae-zelandiae]|uniref:Uncharacterized protein n=1 Tax=Armillaria novae-zelandiae TaxID=153914 RepID=A0AA39NVD7_9AGAR|nr:hypothetical protein IW261DRAFT_1570896 [Armillaria novae-zelandiae]